MNIIKQVTYTLLAMAISSQTGLLLSGQTVDLAIVGGGIAGLSAGIQAKQLKLDTLIIVGKQEPGLARAEKVTNWPGEEEVSGLDLIKKIKKHALSKGCTLINTDVAGINAHSTPFAISTSDGQIFNAHTIIFAAGTSPKKINCPGESDYFGKGVAVCSTCDGPLYEQRPVVIIGNGPNALYEALALSKFTSDITIISYKSCFNAPDSLQKKMRAIPGIKILLNTRVEQINGNKLGVVGVAVTDIIYNRTYTIPTDGVFIAIGNQPNTHLMHDQIALDGKGYIQLNGGTKTSVPGIFAAGNNCAANTKQAIAAAGSGCQAAVEAEKHLRSKKSTCAGGQ